MQGLVPALIGMARVLTDDDLRAARGRSPSGRSRPATPCRSRTRCWPAGGSSCAASDRAAAPRHAEAALEQAHTQLDRPAVAEALLLLAAIQEPPSAS